MRNAKTKALRKFKKLSKALAKCGIAHELYEDKDNGIVGLRADIWNCIDGSNVLVEVYGMAAENYQVDAYAQPDEQMARMFA